MHHSKHLFPLYTVFSSLIAALGSFLFGYHTAIISGAVIFIAQDFQLTDFKQELLISTTLIGAIFGALAGGISDFLGRKRTLIINVFFYLLATILLLISQNFLMLMGGRVLVGFACGLASILVPLYIAEIAPVESRGRLVSLNQLLIVLGVFVSFLTAYLYADTRDWRAMFSFALYPALFQLICLFFVPETPSWLFSKNRKKTAEKVLQRLRLSLSTEHQTREKRLAKTRFKDLLSPSVRVPFLIGIGISVFQQITGINTVIYYAPRIFQLAGFPSAESAILATVWIGTVNVVMTVLGLWLVDKIGRKPLLLAGVAGMGLSLLLLGFAFQFQGEGTSLEAILALLAYVGCFAPGLGIIAWLIISEIYPLGIRGRAMSIATFANWSANYIVSLTFLSLVQLLTAAGTYWLFAFICILCFIFTWKKVPETKGKTFDQIQSFWQK